MKWKALLRGHEFDLLSLAEIFHDGDPKVSKDSEGRYGIESSTFDSLDEATEVSAEARRLLTTMNGAAKALDASYRFVELAGQFQDEHGLHAVLQVDNISMRSRASNVVLSIDGVEMEPPPSPARAWHDLAKGNKDVEGALRLLGTVELDWVALYKLVELVEHDVAGGTKGGAKMIREKGWATKPEQSAFGAAADRPDVSGDAARHARIGGPPPKRAAMTLVEARQFVHRLVRSWLDWRSSNP